MKISLHLGAILIPNPYSWETKYTLYFRSTILKLVENKFDENTFNFKFGNLDDKLEKVTGVYINGN